jgi:hypothetical protein
MRRRVRLDDEGMIHVRTRRYRDDLLTTRWEELVMSPEEALDFYRDGMSEVLRLRSDRSPGRAGRRGA